MKKVLYITNIEVPYRTSFFNEMAKYCDLTVLYERKKSSNRNDAWAKSIYSAYKKIYLKGLNIKREYKLSFGVLNLIIKQKFDVVIFGCLNSLSQIIAMQAMRLFKLPYYLNIDGEYYFEGESIKKKIKRYLLSGAFGYFVAGKTISDEFSKYVNPKKIHTYRFSSLSYSEIEDNAKKRNLPSSNNILVIGQYFEYKGIDVLLECVEYFPDLNFTLIGSGNNSLKLKDKVEWLNLHNVEVIPFLQKDKLFEMYRFSKAVILPSLCECWGLVINEAASFGCPIIATDGSGAAREFLQDDYSYLLAKAGNVESLKKAISNFLNMDEASTSEYKEYLIQKSQMYYIENNVKEHMVVIDEDWRERK